MSFFDPQLSRVRTVLFGGMVLVWFSETLFLGFPALNKVWSDLWQVAAPANEQLVTALHAIWATEHFTALLYVSFHLVWYRGFERLVSLRVHYLRIVTHYCNHLTALFLNYGHVHFC